MKAIAVYDFPLIEDSESPDYSFFYSGAQADHRRSPHYFVYEKKRDFLSAPRAFIVLEIVADHEDYIEFDADLSDVSFPDDAQSNFYRLHDSQPLDADSDALRLDGDVLLGDDDLLLGIVAANMSIGFSCVSIKKRDTLYHLANSRQAMSQFLLSIDSANDL